MNKTLLFFTILLFLCATLSAQTKVTRGAQSAKENFVPYQEVEVEEFYHVRYYTLKFCTNEKFDRFWGELNYTEPLYADGKAMYPDFRPLLKKGDSFYMKVMQREYNPDNDDEVPWERSYDMEWGDSVRILTIKVSDVRTILAKPKRTEKGLRYSWSAENKYRYIFELPEELQKDKLFRISKIRVKTIKNVFQDLPEDDGHWEVKGSHGPDVYGYMNYWYQKKIKEEHDKQMKQANPTYGM